MSATGLLPAGPSPPVGPVSPPAAAVPSSLLRGGTVPEELPVPREAAERVLGYLIFHRSLIDDASGGEDRSGLLERYLALVRGLKDGVHVVIDDPVEKATALLFELVLGEEFDPWEIDLVRFTRSYLERVRTERSIDFAVSGRLMYMAWSILYLQSRALLRAREAARPVPPGSEAVDPSALPEAVYDDGYLGELTTPEAVAVTSAVLDRVGPPPLEEMVRHPQTRPVSLLELVQAFGEAEAEARESLRLEQLRERLREEQRAPPEVLVHGDVPESDLADTWAAVRRRPVGTAFPFLSLWRPELGRDRLVALFLASLFLAQQRAVDLTEDRLGAGTLSLTRLAEERPTPAAEARP